MARLNKLPLVSVGVAMALTVSALLAGCSSPDEVRAAEAVARAKNRAAPGYVRLLNLSPEEVSLQVKGTPRLTGIAAGTASRYTPVGIGKQSVAAVAASGRSTSVDLDLKSDMGTTVVVLPNFSAAPLEPEDRYAGPNGNVRVIAIDSAGKSVAVPDGIAVKGTSGPQSGPTNGTYRVGVGSATVSGSALTASAESTIEPEYAYTVVLKRQANGKYEPFFLLNSPPDKPAAGAQMGR